MIASTPIGFLPAGGIEIVVVLFLLVILFWGPKKIPKLARATGQATNEFKRGREELEEEIDQQQEEEETSKETEEE